MCGCLIPFPVLEKGGVTMSEQRIVRSDTTGSHPFPTEGKKDGAPTL